MGNSTLGDTDILNNTVRSSDDRGRIQLGFTLPSGRKVVSEWINPDALKGKVMLQWCGLVRDQDEADYAAREQAEADAIARKQARLRSSPAPSTEHVPVGSDRLDSFYSGSEEDSAKTSPALSNLLKQPSVLERQKPSGSSLPDDPSEMASAKLAALFIQHAEVEDQLAELIAKKTALESSISRWQTVVNSLRGESVVQPPGPRELGGAPMQLIYVPSEN